MTKLIAWYLPQFHRVKENDEWWGEGFTEWNNVRKWEPAFPGHKIRKPHADIGEYDLLDVNIRRKQAELAKKYGVYGFCYYHYWFGGKKLLEKPLELMLKDGEPNLPFCLSWANETWARRWNAEHHSKQEKDQDDQPWMNDSWGNINVELDKQGNRVLMEQTYGGQEEWEQHLQYLLPFFRHPNYIKVDNKPVFLVLHLSEVPNYIARFDYFRTRLKEEGFAGLHLVRTLGVERDYGDLPGVDAVVEFPPHVTNKFRRKRPIRSWLRKIKWLRKLWHLVPKPVPTLLPDTAQEYEKIIRIPTMHERHYRGVFAGWDSSPRGGKRSVIYNGLTPELFGRYLKTQKERSGEFLFINAWNEWGEGAVLEPDDVYGYKFLETIAKS